jgi:hypothetical protein
MTSCAGVWSAVIISIMTGIAGGIYMGSCKWPVIIVYWESGRLPARVGGMAHFTISWESGGCMIRVIGAIIVRHMASCAGVGCAVVISIMTGIAGGIYMGSCKRPVIIVYWESGRLPARVGGMACCTVCSDPDCIMVRVCCLEIVCLMASDTGIWGIVIIPLVAGITIIRNTCMCARQRVILIVDRECGRLPAGICRVAVLAVCGNTNGSVIRVCSFIIISFMAGNACGWSTGIPGGMTSNTI